MSKNGETGDSSYSTGQRIGCMSMAVAGTLSLSIPASRANLPMPDTRGGPLPVAHISDMGGWQSFGWHIPGSSSTTSSNNSQSTSGRGPSSNHQNSQVSSKSALVVNGSSNGNSSGGNLNLASSSQSFQASNLANFKTLTIQVGSEQEVVSLGTKLTGAEVVAAEQVLTGAGQTIKLNNSGDATGGTIALNGGLLNAIDNSLGGSIGSLTISQGVKVIDEVSQLSVSGSLSNYGSILTASTARGATDSISAGSMLNAGSGSIASYSGGSGLYGASSSLTAPGGLTNNGSISSAGNLSITAPTINNVAASGGSAGQVPTITAAHNVNLDTQSVNNSGTITAQNGNININSNNADLTLTGGNYLSNQLNLSAGTGNITTNVEAVTGQVNAAGNCIHLNADTENLDLGKIDASGDPLVTNTGSLSITSAITASNGADLTLIAGGDITGGKGNKGLNTSSKTGDGGNLTLIAGASFQSDGGTGQEVTGPSSTGGSIDLSGTIPGEAAVTSINTSGAAGQTSGSVTMIAFFGTGGGSINTSKTTITTEAGKGGTNGDVTMIAGVEPVGGTPTAITTGSITGNNITLTSATPTNAAPVDYNANGTLNSGSFSAGTQQTAIISTGTITASGNVSINAGFQAFPSTITGGSASTISVTSGGGGANLNIIKAITGNVIDLTSSTANVSISAPVGTSATNSVTISASYNLTTTGSAVVSGGTVSLNSTNGGIGSNSFLNGKEVFDYFEIKATDLSVTAAPNGAFIKQTGNLTIDGTVTAPQLGLTTTGSLTIGSTGILETMLGTISAESLVVNSSGTLGESTGTGTGTLNLTVTGKGNAINNSGIINGNIVTLTETNAAATFLNNLGGVVETSLILNIFTSNVVNNGNFGGTGNGFGFNSKNGNLAISGSGTFTTGPQGGISFNAKDSITVTDPTDNLFIGLTQLDGFVISCSGNFTSPITGITTTGGTAGLAAVSIFCSNLVYNGQTALTGPFVITANGTASTTGGSQQAIDFFPSSKTANITIGNSIGDYQFSAPGVNSGAVTVFTEGTLTVNNPATNLVTTGQKTAADPTQNPLVLQGEQGVIINGSISTQNSDLNYSDLQIITNNSKTPFVINSGTSTTTTNGIINGGATALSTGNLTIDNAGGLTVNSGTQISAATSISTNAGVITNNSVISAPSWVVGSPSASIILNNNGTISSPSANLLLSVTSGGMTVFNGASAAYTATGTITFNSTLAFININGPLSGISAHDIDITAAKGSIGLFASAGTGSILAAAEDTNSNGGQISISGTSLTTGTTGATLEAQSGGTTNGGSVEIDLTGNKPLTIGATGLTINTAVTGTGPAGTVTIINNGNVSVTTSDLDMTNASTSPTARLSIIAQGSLYVSDAGPLSADNMNFISLASSSSTTFLTGGAKTTGNGIGSAATQLTANQINIVNNGSIDVSATAPSANNLTLQSNKGSLIDTALDGTIAVNPDSSGNGGTLIVTVSSLVFGPGGGGFNADSSMGTGSGGSINVIVSGTKPLSIGTSGITLSATNGGTQGGSISFSNGGNLTVDASTLGVGSAFGVGMGANLSLISTGGTLLVNNTDAIANIGLNKVDFGSNSKTTFEMAAPTKGNGLSYTTGNTFFAASVNVTNSGGSIDYTNGSISANSIGLTAPKGSIIFPSAFVLMASTGSGGAGGTLTLNAESVTTTGGLTLNAAATGSGTGGTVTLQLTGTTPLTLGGATSPISINIANGSGGNGGSLTVSNGGNLTFDASGGITLGSGWAAGSGASLSLQSGGLLLVNDAASFATSSTGLHDLSFTSNSSKTPFTLGSATSGNGIEDTTPLAISADSLTISNISGSVTAGTVASLTGTNFVTLNGLTGLGAMGAALPLTSTAALSITTGAKGSAFLSSTGTTDITHLNVGQAFNYTLTTTGGSNLTLGTGAKGNVMSAGSIDITMSDGASNTDTLTINGLNSTAGNLTVTSDAQTLLINTNASVTSNLGNISLQNTNMVASPQIQFNSGSDLHASGATNNLAEGNIFVVVGAFPTPPNMFVLGTPPPNAFVEIGSSFALSQTNFGISNINPAGSISTASGFTDTILADNRSVNFNTQVTSEINLAANVNITADPPPAAAAAPALTGGQVNAGALFMPALPAPSALAPAITVPGLTTNASSTASLANTVGAISAQSNNAANSNGMSGLLNSILYSPLAGYGDFENQSETRSNYLSGLQMSTGSASRAGSPSSAKISRTLRGSVSNVKHQRLDNGALLLAAEESTIVDSGIGSVTVAAGSVVLLVPFEKGLAVYNLHDSHKGAVAVSAGSNKKELMPGLSAVLSFGAEKSFEQINPAPFVAYRNLSNSKVGDALTMHQAEFQIMSLLQGLPQMSRMMARDSAKKAKALARILKTAAILTNVLPGNEPYTYKTGQQMAACSFVTK